jgi:ABC-type enterochelin transport system substrate-binding protein
MEKRGNDFSLNSENHHHHQHQVSQNPSDIVVTQQSFLDQLKSIGYKGMQSNGSPDRNHLQGASGAMDSFLLISADGGGSNDP